MLIPTNHTDLLQALGAFAYNPATPAELASKLQTVPGSTVDKIFTSIEMIYAYREQLATDGLTILAQLAGFSLANHWDFPTKPGRMQAIYDSTMGALGEIQLAPEFEQPEPIVFYRTDGKDWRDSVKPDLAALKAGKRAQVNDLKLQHDAGGAPTPFGIVDSDDASKIKITGAVNMALIAAQNAQPFAQTWTMADNTEVALDGTTMIQLGVAVGQFVASVHDHARSLKDQIDAIAVTYPDLDPNTGEPLDTPANDAALQAAVDALNAIDIQTGWPSPAPAP